MGVRRIRAISAVFRYVGMCMSDCPMLQMKLVFDSDMAVSVQLDQW